jgi:hypothetical protein
MAALMLSLAPIFKAGGGMNIYEDTNAMYYCYHLPIR